MLLIGCSNWPGYGDDSTVISSTEPTSGANQDVEIYFANNCDQDLLIYFNETMPGSILPCTTLKDYGWLKRNSKIRVTVHKGKIGFIAFAENTEGKCTGGNRRAEKWIDASNASSNTSFFNACQ